MATSGGGSVTASSQSVPEPDGSAARQRWTFAGVSALIFAVALALNLATPLAADDFDGAVVFDSTAHITGLGDIFRSSVVYYMNWSGRVVSRFLLQTFIYVGKPTFDVLNAAAFLGVVLLVYFNANGTRRMRLSLLLAIPLLVWFSLPLFGQSVLWLSGSANYLWPMLWVLGLLLPYRLYAENDRSGRGSPVATVAIVPLALAAGCSNENVAVALVVLLGMYLVLFRRDGRSIPVWAWSGLGGAVVGATVMLAAPGNAARQREVGQAALGFKPLLMRFLVVSHTVFLYDLFALFTLAIVLGLLLWGDDRPVARLAVKLSGMYMIAAFIATYAMVASPEFPARVWTGITLLAITAAGIGYAALDLSDRRIHAIAVVIVLAAGLLFAVDAADVYATDLRVTSRQWNDRIAFINAEKASGHLDIVVPPIAAKTRFNALYDLNDLESKPDGWPNQDVARYFGLRSIVSSAGASLSGQ